MANVDLSIIIPSKNNNRKTAEIIQRISQELKEIEVEFIVIDMNSTDNSVIYALDQIKKQNLRGCVIQSGGGNVSSALNTGIFKSDGRYITFVYPTRLYKNYISAYWQTAVDSQADFIYSVPSSLKREDAPSRLETPPTDSRELLSELIHSFVYFDFTAVMLRRDYLLENHIRFYEDCNIGYVEAFIYNVLLYRPKITCADIELDRDFVNGASREETAVTVNCYDRIEAIKKVYENVRLHFRDDVVLNELFEYQKLPSIVMTVVELLLKEKFSYSAIKKTMKSKGYDKLLRISRHTTHRLRQKVLTWKYAPWLYKI